MTATSTRNEASSLLTAFAATGGLYRNAAAIRNALPHMVSAFSRADYLVALDNLEVGVDIAPTRLTDLRKADLPCLFLPQADKAMLVLEASEGELRVVTAGDQAPRWIEATKTAGDAIRLTPSPGAAPEDAATRVAAAFGRLRGVVGGLFLASLFTNLAALGFPVLVMVVYDQIIPTKSIETIVAFAVAALVVALLDISLRAMRAIAIAHMGSRVERELGLTLFRKLSRLPLSSLEKSGIHEQIARLRQFESLRDLFSGPLFTVFLDLPFVAIFVAVVFYLVPQLGLVIVAIIALFVLLSLLSLVIQRALAEQASADRSHQQRLFFEATKNVASIQRLGATAYWSDRLDAATAAAARSSRRAKGAQMIAQALGQSLMMIAGAGAIAFGAASALEGAASIGALIALMTLVWRILGPFQILFSSVHQLKGFVSSIRQIGRVLALESEFVADAAPGPARRFSGRIEIANVSHRFDPAQDPVLSGVNLSIRPGDITVFCGSSGSGRSTLFSLLNRLYTPTGGAIYFDDVDYRQIDVSDLRRAVTMEKQQAEFFHGTIRQNFELANPTVAEEDIDIVLKALGMDAYVDALPDGVETRLDEAFQKRMSKSLAKGLALARCLLRDSSIYLLDEPCSGLDATHEHKFLNCLTAMRGRRTVLMTSNRPSHWEIADRLVFLDRGRVLVDEPRATALPKIGALHHQSRTLP